MMFFRTAEDKRKIIDLENQIDNLKRDNNSYKKRIEDWVKGDAAMASFSIDWDVMRVFSIERNPSEGTPKTILGYMMSEPAFKTDPYGNVSAVNKKDVVCEWTLYCSAETHEDLVIEFNDWKNKK